MLRLLKDFHKDLRETVRIYHRPEVIFWIQALWYFIRYGASPNDYIRYEFYLKNGRGVNEYITALRQNRIIKALNREHGDELKDDKYGTNRKYGKYISRDWIKVDSETDAKETEDFIKTHDSIVVKPLHLSGGKGIVKYDCGTIGDIGTFVGELKGGEYLIEEAVKQHEEMSAYNPYSVNTLRIYTLSDRGGGVYIGC